MSDSISLNLINKLLLDNIDTFFSQFETTLEDLRIMIDAIICLLSVLIFYCAKY